MITSPNSIARSSLEEMLESIRRRDETEQSKDLPPALPSRPTSKARLPKRLIQAKLAMQHVTRDSTRNRKRNFDREKVKEAVAEAAAVERRLLVYGGAALATLPETGWDDVISYLVKNVIIQFK